MDKVRVLRITSGFAQSGLDIVTSALNQSSTSVNRLDRSLIRCGILLRT